MRPPRDTLGGPAACCHGLAPGIIGVGYTFGLGSMAKLAGVSGWAAAGTMLLAGFIFWALMEATGRLQVTEGRSLLGVLSRGGSAGMVLAAIVVAGVAAVHGSGLAVLAGQLTRIWQAGLELVWPTLSQAEVFARAIMLACLVGLAGGWMRWGGRRWLGWIMIGLMLVLVAGLAGLAVATVGFDQPVAADRAPASANRLLPLIGIALAMPTFLVRPWLLGGGGWNLPAQRRDARIGALLFAGLCLATWIILLRLGSVPGDGATVSRQIAASAGKLPAICFCLVALGAGLTSILPMLVVVPVLLAECRGVDLHLEGALSRGLIGAAAVAALAGLWGNGTLAGFHRLAGQLGQVIIPPVVVGGLLFMVARPSPEAPRPGACLFTGLAVAVAASLTASWMAAVNLWRNF